MNPKGQTARFLIGVLLLMLASFTFSACGGSGGVDLAGGGVSGTGVSTGAISGFGSVFMNGMEFFTDSQVAPGFVTMKTFMGMDNSSMMDKNLFHVGMVVTIHHGPNDNNAQQIEYQNNLQGRIAAKNSGAAKYRHDSRANRRCGDAALFASLNLNEIAEVSGFVDSAGRIRASYIAMVPCSMMMGMCTASEFEVKGYRFGPVFLRFPARSAAWWNRDDRGGFVCPGGGCGSGRRDVRSGRHLRSAAGIRRDHRHPDQ